MEHMIFKCILYTILLTFTIIFISSAKQFEDKRNRIEKIFFYVLFIVQIVRHITYISMGKFTWLLPFHICNISGILACVWLYTKNKRLQAPLYFLSFMAAAALVYPAVNYSWRSPLYYTFIIDHIVLAFIPIYITIAYRYIPSLTQLFTTLGGITFLLMIGHLLNKPFRENYFYLSERPLLPQIPLPLYFMFYITLLFICFNFVRFIGIKIIKYKNT